MTHTSTSPNYQILASLDLGRRQAALEGFELVRKQIEDAMRLCDAVDHHPLLSKYMRRLTTADLIPAEYRPTGIDQPLRSGLPSMIKDRMRISGIGKAPCWPAGSRSRPEVVRYHRGSGAVLSHQPSTAPARGGQCHSEHSHNQHASIGLARLERDGHPDPAEQTG